MSNVRLKPITLKEFVEFAFSLKEMEEVKVNGFPIPKSLTFVLDERNHKSLQTEILTKKEIPTEELVDVFEMEMYGINFIFVK
jgi:hypothetical protein